jgi:hypothetical protein
MSRNQPPTLSRRLLKSLLRLAQTEENRHELLDSTLYREAVLRQANDLCAMQAAHPGLVANPSPAHRWRMAERSYYSRHGEDGLILNLFSRLGAPHKTFIEIGAGDGASSRTTNLILHFGWQGLLVEAVPERAARAGEFHHRQHGRSPEEVRIVKGVVTAENVEGMMAEYGCAGELDLLSLGIGGQDYWVWKALERVRPRVVVIHYNASLGPDRSLTVPLAREFDRFAKHPTGWYHGASLAALAKLGEAKGYVLACCDSAGVNAFLARRDAAWASGLEDLRPREAFYGHAERLREASQEQQWETLRQLEFTQV